MKKCKVLSYNPHRKVVVFDYDGIIIQTHFEFVQDVPEFIYAENHNGMYEILLKKPAGKIKVKAEKKEEVKVSEKKDSQKDIVV